MPSTPPRDPPQRMGHRRNQMSQSSQTSSHSVGTTTSWSQNHSCIVVDEGRRDLDSRHVTPSKVRTDLTSNTLFSATSTEPHRYHLRMRRRDSLGSNLSTPSRRNWKRDSFGDSISSSNIFNDDATAPLNLGSAKALQKRQAIINRFVSSDTTFRATSMSSSGGKWREEQILIICPGSRTTMAQLGCSELTPPLHRIPTRMFKDGDEWRPYYTFKRTKTVNGIEQEEWVEDVDEDKGAVWPIEGTDAYDCIGLAC